MGRATVALGTFAAAVCAYTAGAQAAPEQPSVYVALGDSFAAGTALPPLVSPAPPMCLRSMVNYPHLVAAALGVTEFRDVTCSGAVLADLAGRQTDMDGSPIAPQYDALSADTTLVTVGIGGNDIGLVGLGLGCVNALPEPNGHSCAAANTAGGRDRIGENIVAFAPGYAAMIEQIRLRAPLARILLVGYPTGIRNGGCPGRQPVRAADATYLQAKIDQLSAAMRAQAIASGTTYVDTATSSAAHDACAEPGQAWMVGAIPTDPGAIASLHPNAAGHRNSAEQVLTALAAR
ncbi:SGNH/GDSL hydrolase family protein [Nocardia sp. NPDC057227]|uniref:SGNH/GDSL hydrolase family protein n=1 Tax=Nocardia sp. NPDC057227 TaxID=3346056 RepID=UPI00362F2A21